MNHLYKPTYLLCLCLAFLVIPISLSLAQSEVNWAAWGKNDYAQGSNYISNDNQFISAAAGFLYTAAVKPDSTVIAWGKLPTQNLYGLSAMSSVKKVVAANNFVVALKSDSTLAFWGNTSPFVGVHSVISAVDNATGVKDISAGRYHLTILKGDGTVKTYGSMRPPGTAGDFVAIPSDLDSVKTITSQGDLSFAVYENNTAAVWGSLPLNQDIALPDGLDSVLVVYNGIALKTDGTIETWNNHFLSHLDSLQDIKQITPSIILSEDGTIHTSNNSYPDGMGHIEQIGSGWVINSEGNLYQWSRGEISPILPEGAKQARFLSGDERHSIGLKPNGTVFAWGAESTSIFFRSPNKVPVGLSDVVKVAGSYDNSFALKSDGTVVQWGNNLIGSVHLLTDIVDIEARNFKMIALKNNGTVQELGGGSNTPADLANVKAVDLGRLHSVALLQNGTVRVWGSNNDNQLDIPAGLTNVKAIAAGDYHTLALKEDGTVVGWGSNEEGQLNIPADLSDVVAIAATVDKSVFLKSDGTIIETYKYHSDGRLIDTANFGFHPTHLNSGREQYFAWGGLFPTITSPLLGQTNRDTIPITIDFERPVSHFSLDDVVLNNCMVSDLTTTDSITFEAILKPEQGSADRTTLEIYVKDSVVTDSLGFENLRSNTYRIDYWPNSHELSGRVYHDVDGNCQYDENIDVPLSNYVIKAATANYYTNTGIDGQYRFLVAAGDYSLELLIPELEGQLISSSCQTSHAVSVDSIGESVDSLDFALTVESCPILAVDVSSNRRRRCASNITTITYENKGFDVAEDAKVYLRLPSYVDLISADYSYSMNTDSVYVFDVGTLQPNAHGRIRVKDSVQCVAGITGLDQCTEAWITPANTCLANLNPPSSDWDGATVAVAGNCLGNDVGAQFVIKNVSDQAMTQPRVYRLFIDQLLTSSDSFQLDAGDSIVLQYPPFSGTIRVEADQAIGHPNAHAVIATVSGCAQNIIARVSSANFFHQADSAPEIEVDCLPIIDSFDPNDKLVTPQGFTENRYVKPNSRLEYRVRFQNTGTDTAYKVVVVDTLSEFVDLTTLQIGTTSHPYTLELSGEGQPVLTWTFDNINLPDSTTDEANSQGFLKYQISSIEGLANGTIVRNTADIYFDFNEPIRTNDAWINYYDTIIVSADYALDVSLPQVSLHTTAADVNQAFTTTIALSEPIALTMDMIQTTNAQLSNLTGSDQQYTVLVNPINDGIVSITIPQAAFTDQAGNPNIASNTISVAYDATSPTCDLSFASSHVNQAFTVQIQLSEELSLSLADFVSTNATLSNLQGSGSLYSVTVQPTAEGMVSLYLPADQLYDQAGNGNLSSNTITVTYDSTAPELSIFDAPSHSNESYTLSISFTEPVAFGLEDLQVSNATLSNLLANQSSYSVTVTPSTEGPVTIQLNEGKVFDLAGNSNTNQYSVTTIFDRTQPELSLSADQTHVNSSFLLTIMPNESVALSVQDFTVTNASISNLQMLLDGNYTVEVNPLTEGIVRVQLEAGALNDVAGNSNTASNELLVNYDISLPTVTWVYSEDKPFEINFTVSEAITEALTLTDITIAGAVVADLIYDGTDTYTIKLVPTVGAVTVAIQANTFTDLAGNSNAFTQNDFVTATVNDYLAKLTTIAPNPTTGTLRLDMSWDRPTAKQITITDISGKAVREYRTNQTVFQFNVSDLENGVYMIQVKGTDYFLTKSFVKQ